MTVYYCERNYKPEESDLVKLNNNGKLEKSDSGIKIKAIYINSNGYLAEV